MIRSAEMHPLFFEFYNYANARIDKEKPRLDCS